MAGQHPFDFMSYGNSQLPAGVHEPAALNIAALVAHIESCGLRISVTQDLRLSAALWTSDPRNGPLSVLADPALQAPLPPDSAMSVMLLRKGQPVGTIVQRHIWTAHLVKDMRSLDYWFPGVRPIPPGYSCSVDPGWLSRIIDCWTVYSCSLYVQPDAQHGAIQSALVRLAHALCAVHWQWSWLIGRARAAVASKLLFRVWGAENVAAGVFLLGPGAAPEDSHPHFTATVSRASFEQQLAHPLYSRPDKSIDMPPAHRSAAAE